LKPVDPDLGSDGHCEANSARKENAIMQTGHNTRPFEFKADGVAPADSWAAYGSCEAVGVLPDEKELEAAVDELLLSGFDRQQISVLASRPRWSGGSKTDAEISGVSELEDDPRARLSAFISPDSRTEIEAAAVGIPFYAASIGGYAAMVASGGSLALAFAALLLAGAAGASLGGLLAHTIARHHREAIAAQIAKGGLLLWVQTRSLAQENKAIEVLNGHHARNVHVHDVKRAWGAENVPFYDAQPDPFLERLPVATRPATHRKR
jgi:hypothetical protein